MRWLRENRRRVEAHLRREVGLGQWVRHPPRRPTTTPGRRLGVAIDQPPAGASVAESVAASVAASLPVSLASVPPSVGGVTVPVIVTP